MLLRHSASHWHAWILTSGLCLLLLLEILIVGHLLLLLVGEIAGVHSSTGIVRTRSRDRGLLGVGRDGMGGADVVRRFRRDIGDLDTILRAGSGFGGIKTRLCTSVSIGIIQRVQAAYLDQVLALWLCDEGLEFWRREGVHQSGLGHDEEQHLGSSEDGELVRLYPIKRTSQWH